MSLILTGLALLVALTLIRRSLRLSLGLGGGLLAAVAGLHGTGESGPAAPRRSPPAEPRPWVTAPGTERLWVTAERLNRRSCPSTDCGSLGQFVLGEAVTGRERRDGWVRVSDPYDARCRDGVSARVDSGPAACSAANGIAAGQVAEWVSAEFLSATPPASR